jgi:RNA polymerase sporulation-specific sigma factor
VICLLSFAEANRLLQRAQAGDLSARDQLVKENMGLVHSIAQKYKNRGIEYEDLCQIGTIGLLKAIERFDLSLEYKFSTYAVSLIMGEIKKFLRDDGLIKVSRSLKETAQKVKRAKELLQKQLGREPKVSEIAQHLQIEVQEILLSMEATQPTESIHSTVYAEGDKEVYLLDRLQDPTDSCEVLVDHLVLRDAIGSFSPQEQQIILLRYFKQKTQSEIARMLGISQVSVSRLEKKLLQRLREKIAQ